MSYNSQTELLQFADCQRVEQATTGRRGGTVNQHVQEQAWIDIGMHDMGIQS